MCVDNTIEKLINPAGTPAGGLEPLPNGSLLGPDNNVAQFFSDGEQRVTDNYGTVRGDLRDLRQRQPGWQLVSGSLDYGPSPIHSTRISADIQVPHGSYTLEENHVFNSSMVNTLRLGYSYSDLQSPSISTSNPLELDTTLGILPGCTAPGVSIGSGGLSVNSATADRLRRLYRRPGFLRLHWNSAAVTTTFPKPSENTI